MHVEPHAWPEERDVAHPSGVNQAEAPDVVTVLQRLSRKRALEDSSSEGLGSSGWEGVNPDSPGWEVDTSEHPETETSMQSSRLNKLEKDMSLKQTLFNHILYKWQVSMSLSDPPTESPAMGTSLLLPCCTRA